MKWETLLADPLDYEMSAVRRGQLNTPKYSIHTQADDLLPSSLNGHHQSNLSE